jgi:hypothetical protein
MTATLIATGAPKRNTNMTTGRLLTSGTGAHHSGAPGHTPKKAADIVSRCHAEPGVRVIRLLIAHLCRHNTADELRRPRLRRMPGADFVSSIRLFGVPEPLLSAEVYRRAGLSVREAAILECRRE